MNAGLAIVVAFTFASVASDATIVGHVTDAQSKPIASYSVLVFSTDRTTWSRESGSVMLVRPAQDGGFEVTGLAPGEYWVAAVDAIPENQSVNDWAKPEVLERLSTRATRVRVVAGERFMTILRLIRK